MNRRYPIILISLCILALASLWQNKHYFKKTTSHSSKAPQIIASNIKQVQVDLLQKTTIVLQADAMQDFTKQAKKTYDHIHIEVFADKQLTWIINATHGLIEGDRADLIVLSGQVIIKRTATEQKPASTLTTSALMINHKTHQATSNQKVTIDQANTQISGQGLRADLKTGTIKLLSDIKSRYVPTTVPQS
jgi:lipopolysaccharide export system protein LptC